MSELVSREGETMTRVNGRNLRDVMRRRPGPLRWVWYAFGGRLPTRYRTWVLHDVSTRTWPLRHLARTAVQLAPIEVLLFVLIPGPALVRAGSVSAGVLLGFFCSVAYMYETSEHRAVQAGYPQGAAAATRDAARTSARPPHSGAAQSVGVRRMGPSRG